MTTTRRTRRPAATTGIFGAALPADNPFVLALDGGLFPLPCDNSPVATIADDPYALALDFGPAAAPVEAPAPAVAELPVARYAVHYLDPTAQALAAVDGDEVAEGDVLIAEEESVAGVLVGSWVVAVTEDAGEFERGTVPAAFADAARFAREFMA